MKRTRLRRQSKKHAATERVAATLKAELMDKVGRCEICGHDPARVGWGGVAWRMDLHEIARGCHRAMARGKRFSSLLVCYPCHEDLGSAVEWPESRQLAALRRSRPADYDLAAYIALVGRGPVRITEEEVDAWQ